MSDDKAYLNSAVLDIISAIDKFRGSGDPCLDFQPIVFKLDFLQRIAVSLDMDELVSIDWTCLQDVGRNRSKKPY